MTNFDSDFIEETETGRELAVVNIEEPILRKGKTTVGKGKGAKTAGTKKPLKKQPKPKSIMIRRRKGQEAI